ncbi:hypothetical protein D9B85_10905, partial [Corynebacterium diphtheriae]
IFVNQLVFLPPTLTYVRGGVGRGDLIKCTHHDLLTQIRISERFLTLSNGKHPAGDVDKRANPLKPYWL